MNENETNTAKAEDVEPSEPLNGGDAEDIEMSSDLDQQELVTEAVHSEKETLSSDDEKSEEGLTEENFEDRVAVLEAQVSELNDKLLRALAEAENVRRRAQRDKEDAAKYGIKNFAEGMLGIADNLGRALASIDVSDREEDSNLDNILVGLEMVQKDLVNTFERYGVKPIKALGAKFDPMLHEAMFEIEDKESPSGTIAQVLEPGYELNGRTLRAAKVGITKGGSKETNSEKKAETVISPDPASRDGQAAYENQTDAAAKAGDNLDQEL